MKLIHLFENEVPNITDHWEAFNYAETQRKRIPELELVIMKNPLSASLYARDMIKGRWPEAEPIIMKDPKSSYIYARDVIKGRWLEAEPFIMKTEWMNLYLRKIPEARTQSKDIPLVLGKYAILDVPNTITDEQVMKLLKIIDPAFSRTEENTTSYRLYFEPQIKEKLATKKLRQTTTKKLMNDKRIRTAFFNSIDWEYSSGDFE